MSTINLWISFYLLGVALAVYLFSKAKPEKNEWIFVILLSLLSWLAAFAAWFGRNVKEADRKAGMNNDELDIDKHFR